MAFKLPKPLITEQGEFPFLALTLIVSPSFQEDKVEPDCIEVFSLQFNRWKSHSPNRNNSSK